MLKKAITFVRVVLLICASIILSILLGLILTEVIPLGHCQEGACGFKAFYQIIMPATLFGPIPIFLLLLTLFSPSKKEIEISKDRNLLVYVFNYTDVPIDTLLVSGHAIENIPAGNLIPIQGGSITLKPTMKGAVSATVNWTEDKGQTWNERKATQDEPISKYAAYLVVQIHPGRHIELLLKENPPEKRHQPTHIEKKQITTIGKN